MPRDIPNHICSKKDIIRAQRKEEIARARKRNNDSDNDDSDIISDDEDEDEEMDVVEYRKLLSQLFPSKFSNKKAKVTEKIKKLLKKTQECKEDDEESTESSQCIWCHLRSQGRFLYVR